MTTQKNENHMKLSYLDRGILMTMTSMMLGLIYYLGSMNVSANKVQSDRITKNEQDIISMRLTVGMMASAQTTFTSTVNTFVEKQDKVNERDREHLRALERALDQSGILKTKEIQQ